MKISKNLRKLLSGAKVKQQLNAYQLEDVYKKLSMEDDFGIVTEFTQLLLQIGVDPLEHMSCVPIDYMRDTDITSIDIPDNVTAICSGAFNSCNDLRSVTLPSHLERIGIHAFAYCEALKNITLPNSLQVLEAWSFRGCTSLTRIDIPDSINKINPGVFTNCTALEHITIPKSVKKIYEDAFANTPKLYDVTYDGSVNELHKMSYVHRNAFRRSAESVIHCTDGDVVISDLYEE